MNKITREEFWGNESEYYRNQRSKEQQMGLFTFYKQQQDQQIQQNFLKTQMPNKVTQNTRKHKVTSRFKFQIPNQSPKTRQLSQEAKKPPGKAESSELFLKNIAVKTFKPNYRNEKDTSVAKKWAQNSKTKSFDLTQKQNSNNSQAIKLKQSTELKEFTFTINPEQGFKSRPMEKLEDLVQICSDKRALNKEKTLQKYQKTDERPQNIVKSIVIQQQTIRVGNTIEERTQLRKICKIVLKKETQLKQMSTTLQKLFLKKARERQNQELKSETLQEQTESSKKLKDMHGQNRKYFRDLISSFYLKHNQTNPAAKMLRDTLKFPNFIIKKYHLKTESSLSPDSIKNQTNQQRTTSCKKTAQTNPKGKAKESTPERFDLKPSLNERFKFLLRKQKPMNRHFDSQKLRERDSFIKSQTKK